jgi:hypothetical protein
MIKRQYPLTALVIIILSFCPWIAMGAQTLVLTEADNIYKKNNKQIVFQLTKGPFYGKVIFESDLVVSATHNQKGNETQIVLGGTELIGGNVLLVTEENRVIIPKGSSFIVDVDSALIRAPLRLAIKSTYSGTVHLTNPVTVKVMELTEETGTFQIDQDGLKFTISINPIKCNQSINYRSYAVYVPNNIDLVNQNNVNAILNQTVIFADSNCKCQRPKDNIDIYISKGAKTDRPDMNYVVHARTQGGSFGEYENREQRAAQDAARRAQEDRRRFEEERRKKREAKEKWRKESILRTQSCKDSSDFIDKYNVEKLIKLRELSINPFIYKGKVIAMCSTFEQMISENEALFTSDGDPFVVSNVPPTEFKGQYYTMVAGSVIGTKPFSMLGSTLTIPYIKMEGFYYCKKDCDNLLHWMQPGEGRSFSIEDSNWVCGKISSKALWNADKCSEVTESCGEDIDCYRSSIQKVGGPDEAVIPASRGLCFASFQEFGKVDMATIGGSDGNLDYVFINGIPDEIRVSSESMDLDLWDHQSFKSIAQQYPKAMVRWDGTFESRIELSGGGQRFIFKFVLVNGCRGCEVVGEVNVGFDFDSKGQYGGTTILNLASEEEIAVKRIEEVGELISVKKYSEADQVVADIDKTFPNLQSRLSDAYQRSLVDHRRILDQELGRVDKAIQKDTFVLEGTVTQKSEMQGTGAFWGFELKSDDGNKYVFECNASDTLYFKLKESNIDTYEGYEQLKNVHDRIKIYIPISQKEHVTGKCKDQECDGICPTAIIMFPSTPKHVQTAPQPQPPQPTTAKIGEIIQFKLEKPIGTATVKSSAYLCSDPAAQQKGKQIESTTSLEINGFVRSDSNMVSALEAFLPGQTVPSYVAVEDVTDFKQANDAGAYLEILLASAVFNKSGKVGSKETMKSIDAYLGRYPEAQFAPDAMLDYLFCLEWLFLNDKSVNKDAIVRLADLYVEKAKQRFPAAPQTKKCESVVLDMQNPSANK